jgi:hypothetical protein
MMTSKGTAHGRFQRAIHAGHVQNAEMAAREMGGLSLADALSLCELLAKTDVARYERAALRWLQRFIDERLPPLIEVTLAGQPCRASTRQAKRGRRSPEAPASWVRSENGGRRGAGSLGSERGGACCHNSREIVI